MEISRIMNFIIASSIDWVWAKSLGNASGGKGLFHSTAERRWCHDWAFFQQSFYRMSSPVSAHGSFCAYHGHAWWNLEHNTKRAMICRYNIIRIAQQTHDFNAEFAFLHKLNGRWLYSHFAPIHWQWATNEHGIFFYDFLGWYGTAHTRATSVS